MKRLTILGTILFAVLAFSPGALAEKSIGLPGSGVGQTQNPQGLATDFESGRLYVADRGNNRIDVFESNGTFVMAFGWGVANGAAELQSCGPQATPPTTKCNAGIAGNGTGQFDGPTWVAVDNDPLSPSRHSVYVGSDNLRVQKFDSEGNFLRAFGYDVVAHGPDDSASDETQALTVKASGGSFKLRLEDAFGGGNTQETAPLPFNASAAEVTAALNALSTIGGLGGSVVVGGGPGDASGSSPYLVAFKGNLGGDDIPMLGADGTALTGTPSISVQEQIRGGALEVCDGLAGELCKRGSARIGGTCEIADASDPIAVGPGGEVYVADRYDKDGEGQPFEYVNRVIVFDSAGSCVKEQVLFEPDFDVFEAIRNFAVDSGGNSYVTVAGPGGTLRKYDPSGALVDELDKGTETEGLAVDGSDNVFAKQRGERLAGGRVDFFTEYAPGGTVLKRFGYAIGNLFVPGLAAYSGPDGDLFASEGAAGIKYLELPPPGPVVMPAACEVKAGGLGNVKATLFAEVNPEGKATTVHFEYVDQKSFEDEGGFASPKTKETESESIGSDFEMHEASVTADVDPETEYHCRVVATNADAPGGVTGPEGTFKSKPPIEFGLTSVTDVGAETATLNALVNPLGIETTGYFQYVEEDTYLKDIAELGPEHGFDHATNAPDVDTGEPIEFGAGESLKLGAVQVAGLKPGTAYRFRIVATDVKIAPKEIAGPTKAFRTFGSDTEGLPDNRAFELVSPSQKNSADVAVPINAGGFTEDSTIRIQAGATSGEAVTYTSFISFGEAKGAPGSSQYLSKRTGGGWTTENISPFGISTPIAPPFTGFSPDLGLGAVRSTGPSLASGCQDRISGLYLRDNENGVLRCLTVEPPEGVTQGEICFTYAGSSADGAHAFFAAPLQYAGAGAPAGDGVNLYEWFEGKLRLVSFLPDESPAPATGDTSFGAGDGNCQTGLATRRHVISADGSKAFWTYAPKVTVTPAAPGVRTLTVTGAGSATFTLTFDGKTTAPIALDASASTIQARLEALAGIGAGNVEVSGSGPYTITFKGTLAGTSSPLDAAATTQLLARIDGAETIQLDALPATGAGAGPAGSGAFWTASKDGSVVYFTDTARLIKGSKAGAGAPDLYRYELGEEEPLTDLTKAATDGASADVQGVIGASDDGSHVYFVARGVLSEEANEAGQKAVAGKDNLYLYHDGEIIFIAALSPEDNRDWESQPRNLSARVSPDGAHLAFLSLETEALAGYDNTVADDSITGGPHCRWEQLNKRFVEVPLCAQAFLYDADSGGLTCASCNPSGARPLGPALLPGWTNVYEGPRYLSDNGNRVFFESYDQLLPADENKKRDVYEFERPGEGTCSASSPSFSPGAGGCHFLISTGKGSDESYLVDASANGRDVFLSTRRQLTGWDVNENFDVYDVREGGGFPEPPVLPPPCQGAACRPSLPAPPVTASPAVFEGPGNQARKPRGHKSRKKHKSKKHRKRQARADHKRGGRR